MISMDKLLYSSITQLTPEIYKALYKIYYKEKFKVFNIVSSIIAVLFIASAVYMYQINISWGWCALVVWVGAFLLIYPRVSYRKSYKRSKDTKQSTHFEFYEDYMSEKIKGKNKKINYSDLQKIVETKKYVFIFHNDEKMSVIDKSTLKDSDSFSLFIRTKSQYKRAR